MSTTESSPLVDDDATGSYHCLADGSAPAAGLLQVVRFADGGAAQAGELQVLLHKRLRIVTLIACSGLPVVMAIELLARQVSAATYWFFFLPFGAIWAATLACAVMLWSKMPLSLRGLRALELFCFAVAAVGLSWNQYNLLRYWLPRYAARGPIDLAILATWASTTWILLIVSYGLFVPSTWRRCVAVVGALAGVPLIVQALVGLAVQTVAARSLAHFMSLTAFEVGIAAAMAIFGAHRIEVLYEEALRARRLGQYQLRRRLGSGGMGDVYLAEHVLLRRPCALKVIRPDRAGDPRTMLRFEREVQTTATLTHPNTVQIFDYGHAADGTFYYVMEYLDGMSLEALVKRHGPLPPARAVHVLRQVCGALQEAHAVGLIHRDIKPSNILLCQRGGRHDVAKLLDFGLVQAHGLPADAKLTQEGALAGTPAYMSPEQAGAPMDLDTRSDIYSLGAVAYFLLTGQPPFAGRSAVQVLAAHLYETPAPLSTQLSNVPSELEAILLRSMMKAAAERFADVQSLEQAPADWAAAHPWTEAQAAGWWRTHGDAADFG